jgi:YbbR domain-containing protein
MENKGKYLRMGLSILAAVIVWLYVDHLNNTQVSLDVTEIPVTYLNQETTLAERGLMVIEDTVPTVDLTLQGSRGNVATFKPEQLSVVVDLGNVTTTGQQTLSYKVQYPGGLSRAGLTVESASSTVVTVDIGELYRKQIEIRVDVQGTVADGYLAGTLSLLPQELELWGQQEDLVQVSYAAAVLDIANASSTVVTLVDYELYDYNDALIEDWAGIYPQSDKIQITLPVEMVKELPLTVQFHESAGASLEGLQYRLEPETVTVCGSSSKLEDIEELVLGELSLTELERTDTVRSYDIVLPEGCTLLSGETTAKLTASMPDLWERSYEVTDIRYTNAAEDSEVTLISTVVEVQLRGTQEALDALTAEQITVTADLSGLSTASGTYTVPATVAWRSQQDVGLVKPCHVVLHQQIASAEETQP